MNTGVGFMGAEDTEVGGKITMKDVYAAKVATDGSHSK
jgi:hypothetical protein